MSFQCVNKSMEDVSLCVKRFLESLASGAFGAGAHVVLLQGDLGSGKTTFVQSLAREFGIRDVVDSPTFVLVQEYMILQLPTPFPWQRLVHIDLYRLASDQELHEIGFLEYCRDVRALVIVEWGEKAQDFCLQNSVPAILLSFSLQNGEYSIYT